MLRPHMLYLQQHWMLLLTSDGLYKCVCEAIVRPEVMFSVGVNSASTGRGRVSVSVSR